MGWLWGSKDKGGGSGSGMAGLTWEERLRRYHSEVALRPDFTQHPAVDEEVKMKGGYFKEGPVDPVKIAEDQKFREELLNSSTFQFLMKCQERRKRQNAEAILRNNKPYRKEDTKLWQSLPFVPNPYSGQPMPRKAIKSKVQADATFWDFFKQFHFGRWGYKQRPYPPTKPTNIQQMLGFKWLDKRYADFEMRSGGWYYKDRLGRTRGPMELVNLQTAWVAGIVDKNTFVWGDDMDEWAPICMIYGLQQCVETPDIKLATWGTDMIYRIARGVPLLTPKKGHEKKTYKQLQAEAIEKREREKAVLRLNSGIWPGERAPSHSLFCWAGGSELTTILKENQQFMPDKFIPYDIRKKLAEEIPGLRPWEVLEIEHVMDYVTYGGRWYREELGEFNIGPDFEDEWFEDFKEKWDGFYDDMQEIFQNVDKETALKILERNKNRKRR